MMEIYAKELTELWRERCRADFLLFVSELVLEECGAGDPNLAQRRLALLSGIAVLRPNGAMLELAKALWKPDRYRPKQQVMSCMWRRRPFTAASIC